MKIEKQALVILLTVTVFLILLYAVFGIFYPNIGVVPYTDDVKDGTRVSIEGEILSSRITTTGGHCILDVEGVTVFVEGGADTLFYTKGDRVEVIGIASTYAGVREIVVDSSGSIQLIEQPK